MMKLIAIQGIKGCFHHAAVLKYFNKDDYKLMECSSFRKLSLSVYQSCVDFGVMAIENTIAGTILTNYQLLSEYNLSIIGEIYMPIKHHLMAYPGQKIEDIQEIISHPMAILQCELFIDAHSNIKRVSEYSDTASAAKYIANNRKIGIGVIASEDASREYGLEILYKNIHTIENNFTRFFVIQKIPNKNNHLFNKASLRFKIIHKIGSLSQLLSFISNLGINMTKIQSIPIISNKSTCINWEYSFYVDIVFNNINNYKKMKQKIQEIPCIHSFSIMGEYRNSVYD